MTFDDLSEWDRNLIKDHATKILGERYRCCRFEAISEAVLRCLHAKAYNIIPNDDKLSKRIAKEIDPGSRFGTVDKNPSCEDIMRETFTYLSKHKIDIIKDDTRPATWSTPNDSWYNRTPSYKKPWVY